MAFLDETGLAELWELVKAEDAKVLAADVKIAFGSYTGTDSTSKSLTFDFIPQLVIVTCNGSYYEQGIFVRGSTGTTTYIYNSSSAVKYAQAALTWGETNISWTGNSNASTALNVNGRNYYYIAIG